VKELAAVMEIRSCDHFGERKERDVDRKINVILERERKEILTWNLCVFLIDVAISNLTS
jgi:hypothetical protein